VLLFESSKVVKSDLILASLELALSECENLLKGSLIDSELVYAC